MLTDLLTRCFRLIWYKGVPEKSPLFLKVLQWLINLINGNSAGYVHWFSVSGPSVTSRYETSLPESKALL